MLITLRREAPRGKAVFGRLVVDGGMLAMDTLENLTYAIPDGFYRVRMTYSPRFQEVLPILDGVYGYAVQNGSAVVQNGSTLNPIEPRSCLRTGIRIHAGNTIEHTEGCILVGERLEARGERLLSSAKTLHRLREYLLNYMNQNPNEEVYIEISEPDPYPLYDAYCAPELQQHALDARYEIKRQRERRAKECQH